MSVLGATRRAGPLLHAVATVRARVADVDVVIVGYHSRDLVTRCLDSLTAAAPGLQLTCTVVDNHSEDGTVAAVHGRSDGSRAFDMGANTGFAIANNAGIARGSGRYVLVLNPDTEVGAGAIATLVAFADRQPDLGVAAPQLRNADGSPQQTARAFPTAAAGLFGRRSPLTRAFPGNPWSRRFLTEQPDASTPYEVDWVSGAAMLVPRSVIERVGGFDEGFFLFWEDADWCRRIKDAGLHVWTVPAATVVHDEGGTRRHGWTPRTIRSFHAGAYRYWTKHHTPQPWHPLRWAAAVLLTVRAVVLLARLHVRPARPAAALTRCTDRLEGDPRP